jgi:hypothetical protein
MLLEAGHNPSYDEIEAIRLALYGKPITVETVTDELKKLKPQVFSA